MKQQGFIQVKWNYTELRPLTAKHDSVFWRFADRVYQYIYLSN